MVWFQEVCYILYGTAYAYMKCTGKLPMVIYEKACLHRMDETFDSYICAAVQRSYLGESVYGAVTMSFPYQGLVDCVMSMTLDQNKVADVAKTLFKVDIKSDGQRRYLMLQNGIKLYPTTELTLKGANAEDIAQGFGAQICDIMSASYMRRIELQDGNQSTDCISMILTNDQTKAAVLSLLLDLKGATEICRRLYGD
jgi:hypothetical protein